MRLSKPLWVFILFLSLVFGDVSGQWEGQFVATSPPLCAGAFGGWTSTFIEINGILSGSYSASGWSGTISGRRTGSDSLTWSVGGGGGGVRLTAVISGDSLTGTFSNGEQCGEGGKSSGTITGGKVSGSTTTTPTEPSVISTTTEPTTPEQTTEEETQITETLNEATEDLLTAVSERGFVERVIQASTAADYGSSKDEVIGILTRGGININNYIGQGGTVETLNLKELLNQIHEEARFREDNAKILEKELGTKYTSILNKDPTNLRASVNLAIVRGNQGNIDETLKLSLNAADRLNNDQGKRVVGEIGAQFANKHGWTGTPAPEDSPALTIFGSDIESWKNDPVNSLAKAILPPDQAKFLFYLRNGGTDSEEIILTDVVQGIIGE